MLIVLDLEKKHVQGVWVRVKKKNVVTNVKAKEKWRQNDFF